MTAIFKTWLVLAGAFSQMTDGILSSTEFDQETCLPENNVTLVCNYLPKSIPRGYGRVKIFELGKVSKYAVLKNDTFENETWDQVERLEITDSKEIRYSGCHFGSRSFSGLTSLRELRLDIQRYHFDADDVFAGLPFLKTLDLSGSFRLVFSELQPQLICSECLPALTTLVLSRIGVNIPQEIRMDLNFFRGLGSRNITYLDFSGMHIDFVNLTALRQELLFLNHLNISYAQLGNIDKKERIYCVSNLQYADISYIGLPAARIRLFPGKLVITNLNHTFAEDEYGYYADFGQLKMINASGIIAKAGPLTTVWIHNSTISVDDLIDRLSNESNKALQISHIVASNNRVKYADLRLICMKYKLHSLKIIDVSRNGLEMVHPSIPECAPNLESVDLSGNEMNKMFIYNTEQSIELFSNVKNLKIIHLSENNITFLPYQLFASNNKLEYIDLSNNRLEQVHFGLQHLLNVKMIDLRQNKIHYLDGKSLAILQGFSNITHLNSNPLDCSTCDTKQFVTWLLGTQSAMNSPKLYCSNEHGVNVIVDKNALSEIINICARPTRILASCAAAGSVVIIAVIFAIIVYRYRKKIKIQKQKTLIIEKLKGGEGQYTFAACFSYCSVDREFITKNYDALNNNLQQMTGIDRNLVCFDELEQRAGQMCNDIMIKCQEQSCLVLVVLSNDYCKTTSCIVEFNEAYSEGKPIILMIEDHVNQGDMSPTMRKVLMKQSLRILWTNENDLYDVRPSWDEICSAILDKIRDTENCHVKTVLETDNESEISQTTTTTTSTNLTE